MRTYLRPVSLFFDTQLSIWLRRGEEADQGEGSAGLVFLEQGQDGEDHYPTTSGWGGATKLMRERDVWASSSFNRDGSGRIIVSLSKRAKCVVRQWRTGGPGHQLGSHQVSKHDFLAAGVKGDYWNTWQSGRDSGGDHGLS